MRQCAACEKKIKRNAYSWQITYDRPEGYSKKRFSVRFHNDPKCIAIMAERLDGWSWELGMSQKLEAIGDESTVFEEPEIN